MKTTKPSTADPPPIWDGGPQPEVPWGEGGIDDWGWTAQESSPEIDRPLVSSPATPPKEPKHVL